MPNALAIIGIILTSMVSGAVIALLYYMRVMSQPGQMEGFLRSVHNANTYRWHCHWEKEFCNCPKLQAPEYAPEDGNESHDC